MPRFSVRQLACEQSPAAFPLARMAVPGLDLPSWSRFVAGLAEQGGSMLGVFAGDATLHGIALYRVEESLRGRRLFVDALVTFELNRAAPARAALMAALEREAAESRCATLALSLPAKGLVDAGATKAEAWVRDGFGFDAVVLSRAVDADAAVAASAT